MDERFYKKFAFAAKRSGLLRTRRTALFTEELINKPIGDITGADVLWVFDVAKRNSVRFARLEG